jgi:hypothetical protein
MSDVIYIVVTGMSRRPASLALGEVTYGLPVKRDR